MTVVHLSPSGYAIWHTYSETDSGKRREKIPRMLKLMSRALLPRNFQRIIFYFILFFYFFNYNNDYRFDEISILYVNI